MRATAEVVAIVELSRRRGALVGVLKEDPGGGLLFLLPADPRLPRCVVRAADLPPALKRELKARQFTYFYGIHQLVRPANLPPALKRELKARHFSWLIWNVSARAPGRSAGRAQARAESAPHPLAFVRKAYQVVSHGHLARVPAASGCAAAALLSAPSGCARPRSSAR